MLVLPRLLGVNRVALHTMSTLQFLSFRGTSIDGRVITDVRDTS